VLTPRRSPVITEMSDNVIGERVAEAGKVGGQVDGEEGQDEGL